MKRVALITSRFPYGGKEAFLREEILELSQACDVVVLPALPTREETTLPQVRSMRMRLLSPPVLVAAAAELLRAPRRAFRALTAVLRAPSSLNSKWKNLLVFPTGLAAGRVLRRLGTEHVHAYWLAIPATIAYVAAAMNDIPWSATGHRYDLVGSNMSGAGRRDTFISTAQFIRTISEAGEQRLRSALGPAVQARLFTQHLGVRVPARVVALAVEEGLRLICAANLERVKGHDVLLEAIARARRRGVRLACTLAGDGTLRAALEARARVLGVEDCVHFAGFVPHERLLAAIQRGAYDAAILTSIDEGPHECEGIPIFLAESMAAGLPVIATRSGAVGELVDAANGMLCPPNDPGTVAQAIWTLAADPELRSVLGTAGRATIRRRFDVRDNAQRIASRLLAESVVA